MSSEYRPRRGGQRRSRGGRRQDNQRTDGSRRPFAQKKPGFFEKLFGWFFKKPAAQNTHRPQASTQGQSRSEKPARTERPAPPAINPEELTTAKLYVGNLSYDTVESDLFDLFSQAGAVKNVEVVMDRNHNRSKGFGFVEMEELTSAKEALTKFTRTDFMGRQIIVSGAKTDRRDRSSESSSSEAQV